MTIDSRNKELARLRWLIEWATEHASFTSDEWELWARLVESAEPWNEEEADS